MYIQAKEILMTITNIRKWGNSQGLYIPIDMLRELGISVNSSVTLALEDGAIVIRKNDAGSRKAAAFDSLQKIRQELLAGREQSASPEDTDYSKKYLEYLDERYGKAEAPEEGIYE